MLNNKYLFILKLIIILNIILFNYALTLSQFVIKQNKTELNYLIPDDFPEFVVQDNGGGFHGYLLGGVFSANPTIGSYNFLLDIDGNAVYYELANGMYFKMHPSGLISSPKMLGGNKNIYMIYDNDFNLIDSVQMANMYFADSHDFKILPNGQYLLVAYNDVEIDMSKIVEGGHPNANVTQAIIQELDADKNPVFQWKSLDYIPITDSYSDLTAKNIDYIHMNSMFIDDNGDLILSCRSTSEIIKISRQTGEIIWRMGGKHNEFTFLNEHEENATLYFAWQHDAKILSNGNLLFFDNGSTPSEQTRDYSRVVEYEIDDTNKTAKLVWEYRHEPDISTVNEGNVERLPNGNTAVNWGGAVADGAPIMTEVDSFGNIVYEVSCTSQDIRAYIEKVKWRDEDYMIRDTAEITFPPVPIKFKDENSKDLGIFILGKQIPIGDNIEISLTYCDFAPINPKYDSRAPIVLQKKIVLEGKNISYIDADIYIYTDSLKINNPEKIIIYHRKGISSFKPLQTEFIPESKFLRTNFKEYGDELGEFIFCYGDANSIAVAPILNKPENNAILNRFDVQRLSWSPVGFVGRFILEIASDESFENIQISDSNIINDFYYFAHYGYDSDYYWRVKSVNNAGESDWSETWKFTTAPPYIKMIYPNGGEQLHKNAKRNIIRWEQNTSNNVRIELLKNAEIVSVIRDDFFTTTGAFPWTIAKSLPLDTGYSVRIINLSDSTIFVVSENTFSIIDTTVGISEAIKETALFITNYPNPMKNSTRFEFYLPESGKAELNLYNLKGELISTVFNQYFNNGIHSFVWNSSVLPNGEYYYRLISGNLIATEKIVIAK